MSRLCLYCIQIPTPGRKCELVYMHFIWSIAAEYVTSEWKDSGKFPKVTRFGNIWSTDYRF